MDRRLAFTGSTTFMRSSISQRKVRESGRFFKYDRQLAENADLKARLERLERMIDAYALAVKAE